MTIENFQTKLDLLCSRLQDIQTQVGTLTDIPKLYQANLNQWPVPVDLEFLTFVVETGFVKALNLSTSIDLAKDGRELILFCRHYAIRETEYRKEAQRTGDVQSVGVIVATLVEMWKHNITQHGNEEAANRMKLAFPGAYGVFYRDQLNESHKIATDGH